MSYLVIAIFAIAIVWPITAYPLALGWLVLPPLGFAWWVARTRTRLNADGVHVSSWSSRRFVPWDEVKGVMFPRKGFARLVTTSEDSLAMGGVSFHDLPRLSRASGGRIRDPYSAPGVDDSTGSDIS